MRHLPVSYVEEKPPVLLAAALLKVTASLAQNPAAPPVTPPPAVQQVSAPVPRAVSLLVDVASILAARDVG